MFLTDGTQSIHWHGCHLWFTRGETSTVTQSATQDELELVTALARRASQTAMSLCRRLSISSLRTQSAGVRSEIESAMRDLQNALAKIPPGDCSNTEPSVSDVRRCVPELWTLCRLNLQGDSFRAIAPEFTSSTGEESESITGDPDEPGLIMFFSEESAQHGCQAYERTYGVNHEMPVIPIRLVDYLRNADSSEAGAVNLWQKLSTPE